MTANLPASFLITGMKDTLETIGDFKICGNQLIQSISAQGRCVWFGDVVVGKIEKDADGQATFVDFQASDYCLVHNYLLREL